MATNNKIDIEKYTNLQKTLESQLKQSKTAYTPKTQPTMNDLKMETDLKEIQAQRDRALSDKQSARWYPESDDESKKTVESPIMRGLNALGAPLYGIVGGFEAMLGKGTESGLSNIWANIKERGTFGDLLSSYNAPKVVSAPLGLALDLAFDPVLWMTAGASATIPRIALGISKKGATGATKAISSSALKKAAGLSRVIPGVDTVNLAKKAASSAREFDTFIGRDINKILLDRASKVRFGDATEEWLKTKPWGQALINGFKYSSKDWMKMAELEDTIIKLRGVGTEIAARTKDEMIFAIKAAELAGAKTGKTYDIAEKVRQQLTSFIDDGAKMATKNSGMLKNMSAVDVQEAMSGEAVVEAGVKKLIDEIKDIISKELGKTEVKWFDDVMEAFKDIKIGNKEVGYNILKEYDRFIKLFKIAKIGGNVSAFTNATVGNPTMALMAGINVTRPGYFSNIKGAWNLLNGKADDVFLKKMLGSGEWKRYMETAEFTFPKSYGTTAKEIEQLNVFGSKKRIVKEMVGKGDDAKLIGQRVEDIGKNIGKKSNILGINLANDGNSVPSTFFGDEIYENVSFGGYFQKMLKKLEDAGESSRLAKAVHWYLTQPMNVYQRIDASYKLGTAVHLTNVGVTEKELLTISRALKILPDELAYDAANHLWKFSPEKATELVNDIYMQYGAMPGAVKVLRSLPVFGAPFASFMFGMGVKTGKTVMRNPAAFNKITFMLHELAGQQSPLEKYSLESPYHEWYKRGGMVRLPFFNDYPVYVNMANMIPYYTMNMFQPSERNYQNTLSSGVASVVDKMPIFKTPEGQVMFDYFIQPLILRESNPRGMFDQQLWPTDASNLEKIGYAGRTLAEAVVPPMSGFAGLATPEAALPYIPSYRWRQVGYAKEGKTPVGVMGNEPRLQRTLRSITAMLGLPAYPLNLEYTSSDIKKQLKESKK